MFLEQDLSKGIQVRNYQEVKAKHPAQLISELKYYAEEEMKMKSCAMLYGSGLAMQLAAERHVHGQPTRLPGQKSSYLGLEVMMNKLNAIDYEDYLGQDQFIMPKRSTHDLIIEKL